MRIAPIFILTSLLLTPIVQAANIESGIIQRIDEARSHLNKTEQRISSNRQKLVAQLNALEQEVLKLEEEAAVARRLEDEKTLSLQQLEERLNSWQQQHAFQKNILARFLQRSSPGKDFGSASLSERITAVTDVSTSVSQRLRPAWVNQNVILKNGELALLPTVTIGPSTWFWQQELNRVGVAQRSDVGLKSVLLMDASASSEFEKLQSGQIGNISIDPTLGRVAAREQNNESLVEHVSKGGLWIIPIIVAACVALITALLKALQLWRLPKVKRFSPLELQQMTASTNDELIAKLSGDQLTLYNISQEEVSPLQRDDRLFNALSDAKSRLEYGIGAIAVIASISPLLGLLGTVSGMIHTFNMMTLFGSSDPEVVSGGIAQALVTTELGLIVAIPALILNAMLSRWAKSYYSELENFALSISQDDEQVDVLHSPNQRKSASASTMPNAGMDGKEAFE
ncbi:MAG: MotA/TolQ/ExbB proton channel family protein [Pseudomonadota bacterium]